MENKEIARVLWETADLMEIAGEDGFRIRSYRNGAAAIEGADPRPGNTYKVRLLQNAIERAVLTAGGLL